MTRPLLISGLPTSLARDGWWLHEPGGTGPEAPLPAQAVPGGLPRRFGLVALVAVADVLFWRHAPGLSLAIFAAAIYAVAAVQTSLRPVPLRPTLLLLFAALPVIDHLQPLSVAFLASGLAAALIWVLNPNAPFTEIAALTPALLRSLPGRWVRGLPLRFTWLARGLTWGLVGIATESRREGRLRQAIRDWAFPLAGGLVITGLLMQANPLMAAELRIDLDLWALLTRGMFWTAAAVFVGALLAPDLPDPIELPTMPAVQSQWFGINAGSVLRALGLFNALVAVQTASDLMILAFGARLPAGMTLAEYAHRGAYPLLATALLAGAFALAARPFLGEHRAIRPLLLVWLGQNVILCGAAMLRLEHYIDAFGLTYLRLYALIWMGLVALGLGLVAAQIILGRTNGWLLVRCIGLGLGTLYVSAFVNFAQIIAGQNLRGATQDIDYICDLGPMAHAALTLAPAAPGWALGRTAQDCALLTAPRIEGWRDWGFRSWHVARYTDLGDRVAGWTSLRLRR